MEAQIGAVFMGITWKDRLVQAQEAYSDFVGRVRKNYVADRVKDGVFGAMMDVQLVNDVSIFSTHSGWVGREMGLFAQRYALFTLTPHPRFGGSDLDSSR